ncbi:MAG: hypothetical protein ACLUOI_10190, partial [Eisenbergiella sp.]
LYYVHKFKGNKRNNPLANIDKFFHNSPGAYSIGALLIFRDMLPRKKEQMESQAFHPLLFFIISRLPALLRNHISCRFI